MKHYNTIIIGAGPSGLCCSYYLKEAGIPHIILEKDEVLHTWKNERWDSFNLVTPNWMTRLPGMEDVTPSDNKFMTKKDIVDILEQFAEKVDPEVLEYTTVETVIKVDEQYYVKSDQGTFQAENVIISIGLFNTPQIPKCSEQLPESIMQIHSVDYKNPDQLNPGNALVIGAGRSGVQIAYEIEKDTDRQVWLALGTLRPIPAIHQFTNGVYWLNRLSGFTHFNEPIPYMPEDTDNHNIMSKLIQNLGGCVKLGIKLTGRFKGYKDNAFNFESNLVKTIEDGKKYLSQFTEVIDTHIDSSGLEIENTETYFDLPELSKAQLKEITSLDATESNIKNVIWCTGFKANYSWIKLDVFDAYGYPIHSHGKTDSKGLYFTGLSLDPGFGGKSGFGIGLFAIGEDAKRVVGDIINSVKNEKLESNI